MKIKEEDIPTNIGEKRPRRKNNRRNDSMRPCLQDLELRNGNRRKNVHTAAKTLLESYRVKGTIVVHKDPSEEGQDVELLLFCRTYAAHFCLNALWYLFYGLT